MSATSVREGGPALKGPFDFKDSPLSRATRQPLLLGLFLNLQDINISTYPTGNSWTFDYNVDLVRRAEQLGPPLDAFVALGAMAAVTESILLISTMHVLYGPLHPLRVAKYGATLDHIAKGRWGINVVTSPGTADIESALETLPAHIASIREAVTAKGRSVKILINPIIVSRDTPEEAWEYANNTVKGIEVHTGTKKFGTANGNYDSDAHAWRGRKDAKDKKGLNLGGNIEIIGSPEQVVEQLDALHKVGIDGVVANFYDFAPDLEYFGSKILPLIKEAGLRVD
ncbi:FMNH(2)-dependent dimethylsulfone monooxygenase [Colletotrichum orbiculare MAFF 240422]|uniref:FMNH(2)-dependent dimethylsulfone monooxygenase n=1 Tax=Colletotrichum orbiculare (strain 104-T / ATCC 96160 / CBS 514.97 / LARS 414 / MAFF 240422) TaxID=1213857 RepID=N4V4L4_COLOR|nr:FMNH(2)-dependent dimethylsulfone monooxygenase [Colletotrichum orbiculare MAFF 240422]